MARVWFDDPRVLWETPGDFFPKAGTSGAARVNAATRFLVYAFAAMTMARWVQGRSAVGMVAAGVLVLAAMRALVRVEPGGAVFASADPLPRCRMPTADNPFGHRLPGQPFDPRAPCGYGQSDAIGVSAQERLVAVAPQVAFDRQFATSATPDGIPDTKKFRDFVYGRGPTCKETAISCRPGIRAKFPGA